MNAPTELAPLGDTAVFSECGTFRYRLTRDFRGGLFNARNGRYACFVMLNPSTADAVKDDATIRRCSGHTADWVCGGMFVVNLFAFRATDPRYLAVVRDPIGPKNNDHIIGAVCRAHESGGPVVAAWGVHGGLNDRDRHVMSLLTETLGIPVQCLGTTVENFPRHPLYLTRETPLQPYAVRPLKGD